ncbi:CstA-like transporter-associated (seleno)protein [Nocardioides speluncae]|uniref:CstA-like transporter-associated (seleno)protein n=1 Tax=Nocardioides speluncae TaxID=2670337 RepID=UPI000D69A4EF|nr:CstA-like transporter-associated (seleno)protein [Nocardioides speluncae]
MKLTERLHGLRRLLREATGEAKWDDYLAQCRVDGTVPVSRRAFERHRAHVGGNGPQRCC